MRTYPVPTPTTVPPNNLRLLDSSSPPLWPIGTEAAGLGPTVQGRADGMPQLSGAATPDGNVSVKANKRLRLAANSSPPTLAPCDFHRQKAAWRHLRKGRRGDVTDVVRSDAIDTSDR
jgi:hypothetical protein